MGRRPDGQEMLPPLRYFDWPSANDPETIDAGLQSLLLIGLEQGAKLCDILGETVEATACREAAGRMRGCTPKRPSMKNGVAFMALAGYLDLAEANREWLAPGGGAGLSAFHGYYVLQARAMAGDYTGCLNAIRDYWGGMLDLGATTFWEHFDMDWIKNAGRIDELPSPDRVDVHASYGEHCYIGYRHSFCHGWAGGPTAWLTEHVLGLQPIEPGCRRVRVAPQLGDLDYAEGVLPTPHGLITVRHEARPNGVVNTTIDAPEGVELLRE